MTLVALVAALFVSFPSYEKLLDDESAKAWEPILQQFESPLTGISELLAEGERGTGSHASKKTFRLTVPVVGHFLGLGILGALVLQFVAGVLLFYFAADIVHRSTGDRSTALFATLAVGFSSPGIASFVDLGGFFDGVALFFLAAAIRADRPLWIGTSVFLAAWTDERALIASSLVLLYHSIRAENRDAQEGAGPDETFRITFLRPATLAVVGAWIGYFALRFSLAFSLGLETATGGVGLGVFLDQVNMIPMGVWSGLEGGWLLVALAILALVVERRFALLAAFLFFLGVVVAVALSVVDVTRSMTYALPALFVAIRILARVDRRSQVRLYSALACLVSLAWATYGAGGPTTIWWHYPLPVQIARWITGGA